MDKNMNKRGAKRQKLGMCLGTLRFYVTFSDKPATGYPEIVASPHGQNRNSLRVFWGPCGGSQGEMVPWGHCCGIQMVPWDHDGDGSMEDPLHTGNSAVTGHTWNNVVDLQLMFPLYV